MLIQLSIIRLKGIIPITGPALFQIERRHHICFTSSNRRVFEILIHDKPRNQYSPLTDEREKVQHIRSQVQDTIRGYLALYGVSVC